MLAGLFLVSSKETCLLLFASITSTSTLGCSTGIFLGLITPGKEGSFPVPDGGGGGNRELMSEGSLRIEEDDENDDEDCLIILSSFLPLVITCNFPSIIAKIIFFAVSTGTSIVIPRALSALVLFIPAEDGDITVLASGEAVVSAG